MIRINRKIGFNKDCRNRMKIFSIILLTVIIVFLGMQADGIETYAADKKCVIILSEYNVKMDI